MMNIGWSSPSLPKGTRQERSRAIALWQKERGAASPGGTVQRPFSPTSRYFTGLPHESNPLPEEEAGSRAAPSEAPDRVGRASDAPMSTFDDHADAEREALARARG